MPYNEQNWNQQVTDGIGRMFTARQVGLSRELWALALTVATFRTGANDPVRADDRDRGPEGNLNADLQGAIGEIVAIVHAEKSVGAANITHDIGEVAGPVDDVDLRVSDNGCDHRIEVKTLIWEKSRRRMLVNERAHHRSIRRGASGYLPVLTCIGGNIAIAGPLFNPQDLNDDRSWLLGNLPGRNDPAYSMELTPFCAKYLGMSWDSLCGRYIAGHEWSAISPADFDKWCTNLYRFNNEARQAMDSPAPDISSLAGAVMHVIDR